MRVQVRPLAAADHEGWLPLWEGYLEFYKAAIPSDVTAETSPAMRAYSEAVAPSSSLANAFMDILFIAPALYRTLG